MLRAGRFRLHGEEGGILGLEKSVATDESDETDKGWNWAQFGRAERRAFGVGEGFSLGGGPFGEQSALHVVEQAPIGGRFEAFTGDFRERLDDVKALFANHFWLGCR